MNNNLNRYFERIEVLKRRKTTGSFENLTERQRNLFEGCQQASGGSQQKIINHEQIKLACGPSFDTKSRSNFVTDFCYNKVNREDNENKFLFCVSEGNFQFVNFNWMNNREDKITWSVKVFGRKEKEFIVGAYRNGEFKWQFDELMERLRADIKTR